MQGAVSSPELSRPAQDPILRLSIALLLMSRPAVVAWPRPGTQMMLSTMAAASRIYLTSSPSLVLAAFTLVLALLGTNSPPLLLTGMILGLFSPLSPASLRITSFDIWKGGQVTSVLRRTLPDASETLLGKPGVFSDKHSLAAEELLQKLRRALQRLSALRALWDERVAFFQWIMRGVVGYVPLVGLPQPSNLHAVDAAFHNLVLAGMGVRSTVERMSLLAACGGTQLPSVVESILAAAGADLLLLLSGRSEALVLARDALRDALNAPPVEAEALGGLVVLALRLLAAYGFHVCVQPDRFTARVLNALPRPSSQPLVGSFRPVLARPSLTLARVGFVANSLRRIFAAFVAEGRPRSTWSDLALWSHVLPAAFPFSLLSRVLSCSGSGIGRKPARLAR